MGLIVFLHIFSIRKFQERNAADWGRQSIEPGQADK